MSAASVSIPPGRLREAGLVELHHLDLQLRPVEGRDRPQPVDPHALALGVLGLLDMGRHLPARAAVDDQRLVRTHPTGHPGGVHRRVAAAVDRHAAPDHRLLAGRDAAQERHRVHDLAGIPGRDVDALGEVGAHRDEDRVEAALLPLGREILDRVPAGHPHAHRRDPVHLAAQDVAGHPVFGDAVAHHPARLGAGVADLDLVAQPGQVVGSRQPARPGADDEHPLAGGDRRRVERPSLLQRQVAQEPLDRVDRDGAVELGAVADALARVVTDPPVNRRERIVGHQLAPRLLVTTRRACAPARPGCSRPPGSRRCKGATGRRRPGGAHGPVRCWSARGPDRAAASGPVACRSYPRRRPSRLSQSPRTIAVRLRALALVCHTLGDPPTLPKVPLTPGADRAG